MNDQNKSRALWGLRQNLLVFTFIALLVLLFMLPLSLHKIRPGEMGVLYRRLLGGTAMERTFNEGLNFIFPWDILYRYNVRVQKAEISDAEVLSKSGLHLRVTAVGHFQLIDEELPFLHKSVGPDYVNRIVLPEINMCIKAIFSDYLPEELWNGIQGDEGKKVERFCGQRMREQHIILHAIYVNEIKIPQDTKERIEHKIEQYHKIEEEEWRIKKEMLEVQRKEILAKGLARHHQIIDGSINEELLLWQGLKATSELIQSDKTQVIFQAGDKNGLPVILNHGDLK